MRRYWVLPAILGVALLGTGIWGYSQFTQRRALEVNLSNQYQRAFYEMVDHVEKVQTILGKSQVAVNPKAQAGLYSDLWYQSLSAQENLSQLPVNNAAIARTSKFLNQLGDYAYALNKQAASGKPPGEKDINQLNKLYVRSVKLHDELQRAQMDILDGRVSVAELQQEANAGLWRRAAELKSKPLGLQEKQMDNYPTLIYDGPFSDHMERQKPRGVTGQLISNIKAHEIARAFIDNPRGWIWQVKNTGDKKGKIPAYGLELWPANTQVNERVVMDVSKTGGHVLYMLNTRPVGDAKISMEEAKSRALKFLKSRGIENMEPTYMLKQNKVAVISCVYKQDDVVVYPDLIKVQVALDDGQVVGYEATGYLMAHTDRKLEKPKITAEEAKRSVTARLQVQRVQLALIPTESAQEILTYEVKGTLNGETYFVYVNAKNGQEEKILKVLNTPDGTLTM